MNIIINQPRASYFVGGGEIISFDHTINFLKLGNNITFITLSPESIGLNYSEQYKNFKSKYNERIKIVEIAQEESIKDIYKITPGEDRCRWNIESLFYNQKLYDFLTINEKHYDVIVSYYNLDAIFIPKNLIKKNVLYLCGYPKLQDDFQGSFLSVYDKVIAISNETKEYWQKYRLDNIKVISTGVDTEKFVPCDNKKLNKTIQIVYVGRLISRKNIDKIILAVKRLEQRYDIKLTIVGDGPEKQFLESLSNSVKFEGVVNNPENYYYNSDIFVSPSQYGEGVQGTMLEAMSCGLTIVATKNNINTFLLENNRGILVDSNLESITKGIEKAIKCCRKQVYKSDNREFVVKNFNWLEKTKEIQMEIIE